VNDKPLILIVEDSLTQAKQIAATVSRCDARPLITGNGLDALKLVDEGHPILIILDVNLPNNMNGFQICHRLKRDPQTADIPIIMLTTADSASAILQGLHVGADEYIPKDVFAMDNLSVAVQAFLGRIK
jgi:DNA-binding response OmpR family regulator